VIILNVTIKIYGYFHKVHKDVPLVIKIIMKNIDSKISIKISLVIEGLYQ